MDFDRLIYDLKRRERDEPGAAADRPEAQDWADSFADVAFYRLRRHARFWNDNVEPLFNAVSNLVAGLHGICRNWVFVINGTPTGVRCWFGIAHREDIPAADRPDLAALLSSEFREMIGEAGRPDVGLTKQSYLYSISGAPTPPRAGDALGPIDKLCRGLVGARWQFVVHAGAKPLAEAARRARALDLDLTKAGLGFEKDSFDLAESTYREAMEALRQRLNEGSIVGLWDVDAFLVSPNKEVAARGAALLQSALGGEDSEPDPMRSLPSMTGGSAKKESCLLTSRQVAVLTCPPAEEYPGYEIIEHAQFGVQPIQASSATHARQLQIGEILADGRNTGNVLAMDLDDLTAHALIVGVTGSGKTNTCFQILAQLAANGVPFLVIESAKSEYRELLGDARFKEKPRIFTVGNETVAPLRLNPFEVPPGTLIQTHIDYVKELFGAAFVLYPPMPQVLEQGIEEIYKDCGWDLAANRNARAGGDYRGARLFPILDDLVEKVKELVGRMNYSAEIRGNVTTSLINRLDQLRLAGGKGPMFNTRQSLPAEELFGKPCIVELKSLVSDDEKAFLIGLILIRLYEYHEGLREAERAEKTSDGAAPATRPGVLRHVTLIEEAHRLLRNVGSGPSSDVSANPKGRAIEVFSNMLAEIRAYGEGIVMAEQIPVKLVPDAIKNTNLKIVHRLLAADDRNAVGSTMNLREDQLGHLTRLQKGQAVVYSEKLLRPVLLKAPYTPVKDVAKTSDHDLRSRLTTPSGSAAPSLNEINAANPRLYEEIGRAVRETFRSLLGRSPALPAFVDAFIPFVSAAARASRPSAEAVGDIFAQALDKEISRRGRRPRWAFAAMDSVVAQGRNTAGLVFAVLNDDKRPKGAWETPSQAWSELVDAVVRLHFISRDKAPFLGCVACRAPCHYRYDIESRFSPKMEDSKLFSESLRDRASWPKMVDQVVRIGRQAFPQAERSSQADAAYCYLVHQLDGARNVILPDRAQEIVAFFWNSLHPPAETPTAPVAVK